MTEEYKEFVSKRYASQNEERHRHRESNKLKMQTASAVAPASQVWIFDNVLLEGELAVLSAVPGAGKTLWTCLLAAGITRGPSFPLGHGLTSKGIGHVFILNSEDDLSATLRLRLEAAGANLDMVHFIKGSTEFGHDRPFSFANDQDVERLAGQAELLHNNLALIIVDPIYSAVDGDPNNNFKAREAYQRLAAVAKRLKCAVLGIAHDVKNPQGKEPLARISGPPALREVPRLIMLLKKIKEGPTKTGGTHILVRAKNNNGKMDGGFEYRIQEAEIAGQNGPIKTLKLDITAELIGSAEDLIKEADHYNQVETIGKLEVAVRFLRRILKDGPRPRLEIDELAIEHDIKPGTMINAKDTLKIVTKKRNGDGRSVWSLPDSLIYEESLSDSSERVDS